MTVDRLRMLSEHRREALNSIRSVQENSWESDRNLSLLEQREWARWWGRERHSRRTTAWGCETAGLCPEVGAAQEGEGPWWGVERGGKGGAGLRNAFAFALPPPSHFPHSEIQLSLQSEPQSCPVFLNPSVTCRSFLRDSAASVRWLYATLLFCLAFSYLFTHLRPFTASKGAGMQEPCPKCPSLSQPRSA